VSRRQLGCVDCVVSGHNDGPSTRLLAGDGGDRGGGDAEQINDG